MQIVANPEPILLRQSWKSAAKSSSRELTQQCVALSSYLTLYNESKLSDSIDHLLESIKTPITKIVSLGLGSVTTVGKDGHSRRLKQLAILFAVREFIRQNFGVDKIELYAQDPAFTRLDETFLSNFGITILRTASLSDLGEAGSVIDENTLVYSPFLTVDVYELLLAQPATVRHLIGDDFGALRTKWPKHSPEKRQVDELVKNVATSYRRRPMKGEGFWTDEDRTFPLALYFAEDEKRRENKPKAERKRANKDFQSPSLL